MIKRTLRESNAVRRLVRQTEPAYLPCRATGRHPFGTPSVELDRTPGFRELRLIGLCGCGTVRTDRWWVRVGTDRTTLDKLERLGHFYTYPRGYLLPRESPRPHREDWLAAWLSGQLAGAGLRLAG